MSGELAQDVEGDLDPWMPPMAPYSLGDFLSWDESERQHDLDWCPLCVLDPERSNHRFEHYENRSAHFYMEHDQDDIGRPMSELLPEAGGRR